jgi:hypothetical protein
MFMVSIMGTVYVSYNRAADLNWVVLSDGVRMILNIIAFHQHKSQESCFYSLLNFKDVPVITPPPSQAG